MTDKTQPEALRLALSISLMDTFTNYQQEELAKAAAELRRQHARIAELEAQLEAVGAGGVSGPLMGRASLAASAGSEPVAWRISCPNEPDLGFWLAEEDGGEGFLSEPLYIRTAPPAAGQDARPCHVFTVRKAGGLTEWEPTSMAFALPDGAHALYTLPQPTPHAPSEQQAKDSYIKLLAECRCAFPVPEPGSPLEVQWAAAMAYPEEVPEYVRMCVDAMQAAPKAARGESRWWRKRADEIEAQVALTGSPEAMRCYTDMRTLLQAVADAAPQQEAQEPVAFIHWPINGPPRLVWYSQKALNDAILKTHEDGYKPDVKLYTAPQPAPAPLSESEYKRGYRDGYERRDAEVRGALV